MLKWNEWGNPTKVPENLPVDTPVLVEVDNYEEKAIHRWRICTTISFKGGSITNIGDFTHTGHNPIRWAEFLHLVEKES